MAAWDVVKLCNEGIKRGDILLESEHTIDKTAFAFAVKHGDQYPVFLMRFLVIRTRRAIICDRSLTGCLCMGQTDNLVMFVDKLPIYHILVSLVLLISHFIECFIIMAGH